MNWKIKKDKKISDLQNGVTMEFTIHETIQELRAKYGKKVRTATENGRKVVGCFCSYFPKELVYAADALPVGLCGTTEAPIPIAERVLPRDICPTVKATYGRAVAGMCLLFYLSDCLVGESTCDGRQKMYELLSREKPMMVMDLPKMQEEKAAQKHWLEEVKKLKIFLEQQLKIEITEKNLEKAIQSVNEERRLTKEIHATRKNHPVPITAVDLLGLLTFQDHSHIDHEKYLDSLREVLIELKSRIKAKIHACQLDSPRIMWTGLGSSWGADKVLRLIEDYGAVVVCQEGCGGITRVDDFVDENRDPLTALAERYLRVSCSCISPNETRFQQIRTLIDEYAIDGVVNFSRQFCTPFMIESFRVEELVKNELGLPYIHIISDFSQSDIEQLRVRIESFIELVKEYKRGQEQEGTVKVLH